MSATLTFETYTDKAGEFRWRLLASNGLKIATSGEGYKAKWDRDHAIELIKGGAAGAAVKEAGDTAAVAVKEKPKPKKAKVAK